MNTDKAVADLIYRSFLLLDQLDFEGYLTLCAPSFRYKVTAYSPELRKDMVWKDLDREELKAHLELVPKHVRETSPLSRYPTVYSITYDDDNRRAIAESGLQIYKTKLDGGSTELYCVSRVHDNVSLSDGRPRLQEREIRLETRQLGTGSQIPF